MPPSPGFYRQLARYYDLIFIPPACIGVGLAIGWYLDDWWQSDPWGKLIFILLGVAAGFYQIFHILMGRKKPRP